MNYSVFIKFLAKIAAKRVSCLKIKVKATPSLLPALPVLPIRWM